MSSIPWPSPSRLGPRLAGFVGRWARRRQGTDAGTTRLLPGRVYILPTGVGITLGIVLTAMLLGSMNYNNNLSFLLTFLLGSLGLVAMRQCQQNLVRLEVRFAGVEPVFAGESAQFRIAVGNPSRVARRQIVLYTDHDSSDPLDIPPGDSRVFRLAVRTDRRGRVRLERFGIRTGYPFELFRAWAWLHMDLSGLVYPAPADPAPPPPATMTAHGHRQHDARGEEDFAGLRRFHEGDSPRHVAWKAYARSGQLLSKHFSGADTSSQWLEFDRIDAADTETRLSILTRWIVDADRTHADYGLRLPMREFAPANGDTHRRRCLQSLALYGEEEPHG